MNRRRKSLKIVSIMLIFMLIGALVFQYATGINAETQKGKEKKGTRQEMVTLRTETSRTFLESDGKTYVTEKYTVPIHYKVNGKWKNIDNTVEESQSLLNSATSFKNKANKFQVNFAKSTDTGKLVHLKYEESQIDFQFQGNKSVGKTEKNRVTYPNVYPNIDLVYYVDNSSIKEEWILHKLTEQSNFRLLINTKSVNAKSQRDGSIQFVNSKGEVQFTIPRPIMRDANDEVSYDVKMKLVKEGNKTYLDLQADKNWLQDKKRKFPVVVDPTVTIQGTNNTFDTFASQLNPSTNYASDTFLITGTHPDYGVTRSFIKFDLATASLPENAQISSAKLYLNQYINEANQQVNLYPVTSSWESPQITWNQQPSIGSVLTSTTVGAPGTYSWTITNLVKNWYNGTTVNNGVSLQHAVESNDRKSFRSADYGADPTLKPKLEITYTLPTTSTTYTGTVDGKQTHIYKFETSAPGTLQLVNQSANLDLINVQLIDEELNAYSHGDTLPAGKYSLKINGADGPAASYSFLVSGIPFIGTPDTALPSLHVTNPVDSKRLPKGVSSITVTGTTTASKTTISRNKEEIAQISGSTISKAISLALGKNSLVLVAEKVNQGNEIIQGYEIVVPGTERINGIDKYDISANVSKQFPIENNTVIIASGDNFQNAFTGTPLASKLGAPILLNPVSSLHPSVQAEIERRQATKVLILGDTSAISTQVETALQNMGITDIQRITGTDHVTTAVQIANQVVDANTDNAFICGSLSYPDCLSIASIAGLMGKPLLLTNQSSLSSSVSDFMDVNPQIRHYFVVGGTGSVSDTVLQQIKSKGLSVERFVGSDRYAMNQAIIQRLEITPSKFVVVDATSTNGIPDGISGVLLATYDQAVTLMMGPTGIPTSTSQLLEKYGFYIEKASIIGTSITNAVLQQIDTYIDTI